MDTVLAALPGAAALAAFLAASFLLAVRPGPGVRYIVACTLSQGHAAGLVSVAGVAGGNAVAASLGLAALFALSSLAFPVVQFAGVAYLVFLGIQSLRAPGGAPDATPAPVQPARIFRQGLLAPALRSPQAHRGTRVVAAATDIGLGIFTALVARPGGSAVR